MEVHFIDVGCGNMVLTVFPDGSAIMYDCNITEANEGRVLSYLRKTIGKKGRIRAFINSIRDADHMRGIMSLHLTHPIGEIWDPGVPGKDAESPEHRAYTDLCSLVPSRVIEARSHKAFGDATLRCMNSKWEKYSEPAEQSIVVKIEYGGESVLLAGDTSSKPWKESIIPSYTGAALKSSVLLAPHHGSLAFFEDASNPANYYIEHIQKIRPQITIVSVGPNDQGLPAMKAMDFYRRLSTGSPERGAKRVYTTKDDGTMKLVLKGSGGWSLGTHQ